MDKVEIERAKAASKAVYELGERYLEAADCIKATVTEVKTAKQLWREGNESKLIRLGFTLIALPEPTPISETLGGILVAAGVIQKGIKNHALHVEDIPKTFQNLMKELRTLEECLR